LNNITEFFSEKQENEAGNDPVGRQVLSSYWFVSNATNSHLKHLQHFITVMIDNLDGNLARRRRVEGVTRC
jgi:hypothetical protein